MIKRTFGALLTFAFVIIYSFVYLFAYVAKGTDYADALLVRHADIVENFYDNL